MSPINLFKKIVHGILYENILLTHLYEYIMVSKNKFILEIRNFSNNPPFKFINFFLLIISIASCSTPYRPPSGYAVASWYGSEFHGKPTASGEIFDMYGYTCAHREYPFGTKLRITNTINDKSITCVVNDRGPFVQGRDIDLSYAAAKDMELIETGTATVRVDRLVRDTSYIREVKYLSDSGPGPFTIQVGSFRDASNASRLKTGLELKYDKVYITEAEIDRERFYRVRIGKFQARSEVQKLGRTLADEGYNVFITDHEEKI
jgi:rare lipoprotein A